MVNKELELLINECNKADVQIMVYKQAHFKNETEHSPMAIIEDREGRLTSLIFDDERQKWI